MTADAPVLSLSLLAGSEPGDLTQTREIREEAGWLARTCAGEEAAFRWLLERYRVRVVRLAAHVLRTGDADAQDAAQEAFMRAFRAVRTVRNGASFFPFLCRVTVRVCADRRRKAGWSRELSLQEWDAPFAPPPVDTRLLVEALLDRLSPPLRAALVLRGIEGLEYEDIAHALSVPVGTVRSRLSAARAQFRQLWTAAQEETDRV